MLGRARRRDEPRAMYATRRQTLKELRERTQARRLESPHDRLRFDVVAARYLRPGDCVLVLADELVPADGEILDGAARVDESALVGPAEPTLQSARHAPGSEVAAGTRIVSGWLVLRVTAGVGSCLLARLTEGAQT